MGPILRLNAGDSDNQKENDDTYFGQRDDRIEAGGLAHSNQHDPGDQHDNQESRHVEYEWNPAILEPSPNHESRDPNSERPDNPMRRLKTVQRKNRVVP